MPWATKLVGRRAEIAELEREYRRAGKGEFRTVLLLADAGIGKTRLAREFLARKRRRAITLSARAYPLGESVSFGVWSEVFEGHLRRLDAEDVSKLCGGFLDDLGTVVRSVAAVRRPSTEAEPPRFRLLEGFTVLMANLSDRLPAIVLLDDAHLADSSSWEAVAYMARNIPDTRVLVLAAARPRELSDNEIATEVVLGLEQEGGLERLELSPLDGETLRDLAEAVLNDPPTPKLLDWLTERSRGNPLFAIGLLQALIDEDADLSAPQLRSLPEALAERVAVSVRGLDESELATLEALATVGRRADFQDLVVFTGLPIDRLPTTLERLVRLRLVSEVERGRALGYEVAHPLIEEVVYRRIGGARRRGLHRIIGRSLVAAGRLGEAAPHFVRSADAGDREAIDALRDAVRQAEERGAYREALTIMDALVELVPPGDQRWLAVLDALSWDAEWVVDHRADTYASLGVKAMRSIDLLLANSPDPASRAAVKFRLANFLGWGTGDLDDAERACAEALSFFEQAGDGSGALLAENELAWMRGLRGDYPSMEVAASRVAEASEEAGERFAEIQGLQTTAFAAWVRGRFSESERDWLKSISIAREEGKVYRVTVGLGNLAVSLAAQGRIEEALSFFEQARAKNPSWRESLFPEWEAIIHWFAGDFPTALDSAQEAANRAVGELSRRRAFGVVFAALAGAEMARTAQALGHLTRAQQAYEGMDWQFFSHMCDFAEAALVWQAGRPSDSVAVLKRCAADVISTGATTFAALVLTDLAEVAAESGDVRAATEAATELASIARGIDRVLYHGLAALASASCGDGAAANRAEELLSDTGCKAFHARALDLLGRSLLGTDRVAAVDTLQRAAIEFDACGASWRGDRVRGTLRGVGARGRRSATAGSGPSALTRREWQVARLAAQGRSARDIGAELFISERTVETHLANIYAKLAVGSKTELISRASELALKR